MDPLFPNTDTTADSQPDYLPTAAVLVPPDGRLAGHHTLYDLRVYAELQQADDVLALAWATTRVVRRLGFAGCCLLRLPTPMADAGVDARLREPKLRALLKRLGYGGVPALPLLVPEDGPQLLLLLSGHGGDHAGAQALAARRRAPLLALTRAIGHLCQRRFLEFSLGLGHGGGKTLLIVPELLELLSLLSLQDLRIKEAGARQGLSLRATRRRLTLLRRTLGTRTLCGSVGVATYQGLF